jgi:acyl-CoA hydrolase
LLHFDNPAKTVEFLLNKVGPKIKLGTALGLGKPIDLLNELYRTVEARSDLQLEIYTALCLATPKAKPGSLEHRFIQPFCDRHFGKDYPALLFNEAQKSERLCARVRVHEFYLQAGQYRHSPNAQRSYISLNYTHVAPTLFDRGLNSVVQLVAKRGDRYSLGSNPDLTRDLIDLYRKHGRPLVLIGVVHPDMPFMESDAEIASDQFDAILDTGERAYELFALPRPEVDTTDHMIGLHTSSLLVDDGTLQIGIGSLSDAVVHALLLRHRNNTPYKALLEDVYAGLDKPQEDLSSDLEPFRAGLYGTSEMLMDGFMHLRKAGILKRLIYDLDEKKQCYLHGAFFLGSKDFYRWLRELSGEDAAGLCMTRVSKVNDLYDANEFALRRQRRRARFINTVMKVALLGSASSDTLDSGEVVSGVGGQYNFVAMSHELEDARSILMLRSTRIDKGRRASNIVPQLSNETIARHLRDIVVTEYGVADLQGKSDEEVIQALIAIADVEFQGDLVNYAKARGKLAPDYQVPAWAQRNTPSRLHELARRHPEHFAPYPFGTDFTVVELRLLGALKEIKSMNKFYLLVNLLRGLMTSRTGFLTELARLQLDRPKSLKDSVYAALITACLRDKLKGGT